MKCQRVGTNPCSNEAVAVFIVGKVETRCCQDCLLKLKRAAEDKRRKFAVVTLEK